MPGGCHQPQRVSFTRPHSAPKGALSDSNDAQFHDRVTQLRSKLEEANTNIYLLRTWIGEADKQIKDVRSRTEKKSKKDEAQEAIGEIKEYIMSLHKFEQRFNVAEGNHQAAVEMLKQNQNQRCLCAKGSPSVEELKERLVKIFTEMDDIDDQLRFLKGEPAAEANNTCSTSKGKDCTPRACLTGSTPNAQKDSTSLCFRGDSTSLCFKGDSTSLCYRDSTSQCYTPPPCGRPKVIQTETKPILSKQTNTKCCGSSPTNMYL